MTAKVYTLSGHQLIRRYVFTLVARTKELDEIVAASRRCGKMISNHVKELRAINHETNRMWFSFVGIF